MARSAARDAEVQLYQMQADIAKALANPIRLRILNRVGADEVPYGVLRVHLGISKANLSQHLAILRTSGVLAVRREGGQVHYRLTYPEIKELCQTMRELLAKHLATTGRQAQLLMRQVG